jgi:ribosome-associated protein
MPPDEDLTTPKGLRLPASAIAWRFSRSGGPGGQHANTSDTRVELVADLRALRGPGSQRARTHLGDEIRIVDATSRSQVRNRQEALARLQHLLEEASRPPRVRRPTRPTAGSIARRLEAKRATTRRKRDRAWRPDDG